GMCVLDTCMAFGMVRGGHLDVTVLGALQVSQDGDLANWIPGGADLLRHEGRIGGAMDMATGAKRVIVTCRHNGKDGRSKIVKKCTFLPTRKKCVNLIFTDLAVMEVIKEGLLLKEVAPGWTAAEVQANTEAELIIAKDLTEIKV
ncbi:CoA-transferase, partial [Chloroflexota bacterium]